MSHIKELAGPRFVGAFTVQHAEKGFYEGIFRLLERSGFSKYERVSCNCGLTLGWGSGAKLARGGRLACFGGSRVSSTFFHLGLAALALVVLQAFLEPYRLVIDEHEGPVPNLPESWRGKRVALIADLQVGMFMSNTPTVRRAVARIIAARPAFVMIAGDFIYDTPKGIEPVVALLRPLTRAGLPTFAVLGNHDYGMPTQNYPKNEALARALERALEAVGIRVLHNEVVALESQAGETLYLVGVGAHVPGDDKPLEALAQVPEGAPRIVLMHHPSTYLKIPQDAAPLAVAGHTHGGQVRLPFGIGRSLLTRIKEGRVYGDDWISGEGTVGNRLYINRGIGFSLAPVRLNCPPELTFFTLIPAEEAKET